MAAPIGAPEYKCRTLWGRSVVPLPSAVLERLLVSLLPDKPSKLTPSVFWYDEGEGPEARREPGNRDTGTKESG